MLPNLQAELQALNAQNRYRTVKRIETAQEPHIRIEGREFLLFCSNNYLGLANHPALKKAAVEALQTYGSSSVASALISGYMAPLADLEKQMAQFLDTPATAVFPTGYMANLGIIPTLVNNEDIIFSDQYNHRSIIDGCRLSRARISIYKHSDLADLENQLQSAKHFRRRLIITDGVFSMDGDIARLPDLATLAQNHEAMLMVDDAHGTGVLGATGRGTFEHFDLPPSAVDIHMTSGSKALGGSGGFISGNQDLIELIRNRSAAYIYTTSMPPDACASTSAALSLVSETTDFHQRLWQNIQIVQNGLQELGFDIGNTQTQIIPIIIGEDAKTVAISNYLYDQGIYLYGIRPPTVPEGFSRLRLSLMATHTQEDIDALLRAMAIVKEKFI